MTGKLFLYKKARIKEPVGYNSFFVELLEDGKEILATISSSRFRASGGGRRIRLLKGNIVELEIPFGDLKKGRIIGFVAKK
jgi:translation initiation factor IF-1